jgi:hypothetical protein
MGAGGGATLASTLGAAISGVAGAVAETVRQCCFKKKAAPRTSNASSDNAKTIFGFISVSQHKQKIQDRQRRSWIVF